MLSSFGYTNDDHKIEPLHIMFPEMSAYLKSCFLIDDDNYLKNIMTFGIKLAIM